MVPEGGAGLQQCCSCSSRARCFLCPIYPSLLHVRPRHVCAFFHVPAVPFPSTDLALAFTNQHAVYQRAVFPSSFPQALRLDKFSSQVKTELKFLKEKLEAIEEDRGWLERQLKQSKKSNKLMKAELEARGGAGSTPSFSDSQLVSADATGASCVCIVLGRRNRFCSASRWLRVRAVYE